MEICINIRRRSVTIREILRNQKYVNIPIIGEKNRKIWKTEKLHEKNVEKLEKKLSYKTKNQWKNEKGEITGRPKPKATSR